MDSFGVYAVFDVKSPPQKLLCAYGSHKVSVAVPWTSCQVVVFSHGPWGNRVCVNVELCDAERIPITIGKLTPYNKCLCWEQWEEESWTKNITLTVALEGGNLDSLAPLSVRELNNSKRKRDRLSEEQSDEGKTSIKGDEENVCPDGKVAKTKPVRKVKGELRGSQKPFAGAEEAKTKGTAGNREVQRTTSHAEAKTVGRKTKRPAQCDKPPEHGPSGRWGQTLCPIDAQTAIMMGGQGTRMQFCKDPMWKLCTEDMSWVAAETLAEGPTPEARIGHTAVYDPDSKRIFVFGGSKNKKWFNDVHILDTQSWKWTMVEAQGKVPPLAYHSCSMFRGELFVLGGVFPRPNPQPDGCSDSVYIFDPHQSVWYQPIVTGNKPSPRSGHSASVIQERKIYVFGGWDTPVCYNDMYTLDLGLMEFSDVETVGKPPSPRSWHGSAVLSDTKFLIYGGYNGNNALSDTFIFDTGTNCWTEVKHPDLSVPIAGHSIITMDITRRSHFSEEDDVDLNATSVTKTLLVFGGGDNEGNFYSDITSVAVDELLSFV